MFGVYECGINFLVVQVGYWVSFFLFVFMLFFLGEGVAVLDQTELTVIHSKCEVSVHSGSDCKGWKWTTRNKACNSGHFASVRVKCPKA